MFHHRQNKDDYGRLIPKPAAPVDEFSEEQLDDAIPLQEQLDSIGVKIQLKELYNSVLKDEMEEHRVGASTVLKDLHAETSRLRQELKEAYDSEKLTVQKAMRSQREFQLAMTDRTPRIAIPWLDDKLFDISRRLNLYASNLVEKRKKLEEAESLVDQIERWPRPGTLPWEIAAIAKFHQYESQIEHMRVKLETANILFSKYSEIAGILKFERGKYQPIIHTIEDQLKIFSEELAELQKTLNYAVAFRDSALRNLIQTQKEATENRRRRKIQMVKMKSAVQRVLESSANLMAATAADGKRRELARRSTIGGSNFSLNLFAELIQYKRGEIEKFQDRAGRLVETMRVPDLTFIPIRFQSVMSLGERLRLELIAKEELLNSLIHQKAQLYILLAHFTYTGHTVGKDFHMRQAQYLKAIDGTNDETETFEDKLHEIGETLVKIRIGSLRILEQLEKRGKTAHRFHSDIFTTLKLIAEKIKKLVERNSELKRICGGNEARRNYAPYVKEPPIPPRLLRVPDSAEEESGDSDADDGVVDSKVASRLEMKARSLRFIHNARLRRGLR